MTGLGPAGQADRSTKVIVKSSSQAVALARQQMADSIWFRDWPQVDIDQILMTSRFREHQKSELIYRDGDADELIFVLSGAVWTCMKSDRRPIRFGIVHAAALIGLSRLVTHHHLDDPCYEFLAAEDTLVMVIPARALVAQLDARPLLWRAMTEAAVLYQRHCIKLALVFYSGPVKERLISALYQFGLSGSLGAGKLPQQELAIPQEELATIVQSSRQHVNRALHELAAEGILKLGYKRIEIVDAQALERLAVARLIDMATPTPDHHD